MFFVASIQDASWGANLPSSPVMTAKGDGVDPITTFFVPVARWSDGTPAEMHK